MNANELANEFNNVWSPSQIEEWAEKAQLMLRQLQAENEALKAKLAQADRVYDFDNPLLNSDDVGFKQIELNAELLRKAQEK